MPITERGPTKGPTKVPFPPRAVPKSPPTAPTPRHTHTKLLHESARPRMSFSMGFPPRGLAGPALVSPPCRWSRRRGGKLLEHQLRLQSPGNSCYAKHSEVEFTVTVNNR